MHRYIPRTPSSARRRIRLAECESGWSSNTLISQQQQQPKIPIKDIVIRNSNENMDDNNNDDVANSELLEETYINR